MADLESQEPSTESVTDHFIKSRYPIACVSERSVSGPGNVSRVAGVLGIAVVTVDYLGTQQHNSYGFDANRVDALERMTTSTDAVLEVLEKQPNTITIKLNDDSHGRDRTATYDTTSSEGVSRFVRDTITTSYGLNEQEIEVFAQSVPETSGPRTADTDATLLASIKQATKEYAAQLPDRSIADMSSWSNEVLIGASALMLIGLVIRPAVKFRNKKLVSRYSNASDSLRRKPLGCKVYSSISSKDDRSALPPLKGGFKARRKARIRANKTFETEKTGTY